MTARQTSRTITPFILAILYLSKSSYSFTVPEVTIEAFTPKGFRVSIPDIPGTNLFVFEGNVDKVKKNFTHRDLGSLRGWIRDRTEGRWVFTDLETKLSLSDVINYYVYVTDMNGLKENLSFTVSELVCQPSVTKMNNRRVCPGETIFEEHFLQGQLRSDLWQIEQYLPIAHPDYPFVSYQRSQVTVTEQGHLRITPKLQETMPGFTNDSITFAKLDLFNGCTANAEACYRQAPEPDIVPPVVSGRVRSRNFAFRYGSVLIRAKLPQGDWIYPEILLEPFLKKYGRASYASGLIKIATARGNKQLRTATEEYGNQVLYGGPVMDYECRDELIKNKIMTHGLWGDDFHNFSVSWTPEDIKLSVDGEEWVHVDASRSLHDRFPQRCSHLPRELYAQGTELAPFDDYFYLTFGVSVGGSSEFPDGSHSDGKLKPWRNSGRKAMLHFWRDLSSWHNTWSQPELLIDFVKVVAL